MKDLVEETKRLIKLEEMAVRVGIVEKGNYLIFVNTDDSGNIPHFHCVDAETRGNNFHTCIMISEARYFNHGSKQDKITDGKQRKALDRFLRQPFGNAKFTGSNWDYIVMIWNMNNSSADVDIETQPDYSNIEDYK